MNEEGAPFDSGFDDARPFSVTPEADGVALDAALREFGPAAFEDLLPRLRSLAADLDAAHSDGFIHGRLHPNKVFVTDEATYLLGARAVQVIEDRRHWPVHPPYTAPEVVAGAPPTPMADQYSLAAIAYEWMFGRPVSGAAERPVEVRGIPNVDRGELSRAFTRALTPEPFRRFASCTDFCDALAAASAPSLPLLVATDDDDDEDLGTFIPEEPVEPVREPATLPVIPVAVPTPVPDLSFTAEESNVTAAEPDIDSFKPVSDQMTEPVPTAFATPSVTPTVSTADRGPRFGGFALILAALVGAVFGFAAGYMALPRALQSAPPITSGAGDASDARETSDASDARKASPGSLASPVSPVSPASPASPAAKIGRLLVRSTPPGADVEVDGVARGVTPLALRDLDLGSRQITVSRRGYVSEQRRITLTEARPSRSVEVRLSAPAAADRATAPAARQAPRPSTPASLGKPAETTGALAIDSRPSGATVIVNGKPSGVTPLTIENLPPGEYRVMLSLQGFRDFATTVRVVAGERARAAARLTEQEQE